jgi:hypothetical protein
MFPVPSAQNSTMMVMKVCIGILPKNSIIYLPKFSSETTHTTHKRQAETMMMKWKKPPKFLIQLWIQCFKVQEAKKL